MNVNRIKDFGVKKTASEGQITLNESVAILQSPTLIVDGLMIGVAKETILIDSVMVTTPIDVMSDTSHPEVVLVRMKDDQT